MLLANYKDKAIYKAAYEAVYKAFYKAFYLEYFILINYITIEEEI